MGPRPGPPRARYAAIVAEQTALHGPRSPVVKARRTIGAEGLLALARAIGGADPATFGRSLIAAVDAEFNWQPGTRADDLTVLVLHHNAADPPAMSLLHKARMMAKMMGL